jgi:hypothetical protein
MADAIYPKYKRNLMIANTAVDLNANTGAAVKVALVQGGYTYSDLHEDFADLSNLTEFSGTTGGTVYANGTFDMADVTFPSVAAGPAVTAVVLYRWNSTDANSPLVAYLDSLTGLPVTPNGGDITIQWDSLGIFTL